MRRRTPIVVLEPKPSPSRAGKWGMWVPALVAVGFLVFLFRSEFPVIEQWLDTLLRPNSTAVRYACHKAALAAAGDPAFARVLRPGRAHATQAGFYVKEIVVGEMGDTGMEQAFRFSCYIDVTGTVVKTHRYASTVRFAVSD